MTQLQDDWQNHAREATSPCGERRSPSRFGFNVLEWRTQATSSILAGEIT